MELFDIKAEKRADISHDDRLLLASFDEAMAEIGRKCEGNERRALLATEGWQSLVRAQISQCRDIFRQGIARAVRIVSAKHACTEDLALKSLTIALRQDKLEPGCGCSLAEINRKAEIMRTFDIV